MPDSPKRLFEVYVAVEQIALMLCVLLCDDWLLKICSTVLQSCLKHACSSASSSSALALSPISSPLIYPSTARVVRATQMISQQVSSIFPCSPLPSGTWRTPDLSIPWCCLPTSSSVCFVFFPLSLCLARWFWPDLMNGKHDHTTTVCVSLRSSGGLRVVQSPAGSWHVLSCW